MADSLKRTPLHPWHAEAGAKLADFGGWEMPIEYTGVVAEHTAVREAVGCFDVSHMGKLRVSGAGAVDWLDSVLAADLGALPDGKAQYSMLLNDAGGVVDDLIVYRLAPDLVWIVPNAANAPLVREALVASQPSGVTLDDLHTDFGIIAIQGPDSAALLANLGFAQSLEYMSAVWTEAFGGELLICRTGYTGEHGYELIMPNRLLTGVWQQAVDLGAVPAGLGARDTLRLEACYPLHGQDLSTQITPLEAGLSWAIGWEKPAFAGRESLLRQREQGAPRKRVALLARERGIPRGGMNVLRDGASVGITTSGTFSPTLKQGIALALVERSVAIGDVLTLDVRGRMLSVEVVKPPFVPSKVK